jgi:hypothetical protein
VKKQHGLPVDEECGSQVICQGMSVVFTDLAQGGEQILPGSGFDQQKDFIKNAIINLADKSFDEKVDFHEFRDKGVEIMKMIYDMFDRNSDGVLDDNEATIDKISQKALKTGVNMIFNIFDQSYLSRYSTNLQNGNKIIYCFDNFTVSEETTWFACR